MEVLRSLPAFRTVLAPDRGGGEDGATTSGSAEGGGAIARGSAVSWDKLLTASVGHINGLERRSG